MTTKENIPDLELLKNIKSNHRFAFDVSLLRIEEGAWMSGLSLKNYLYALFI